MKYYEVKKSVWDGKIYEHEAITETKCFIKTKNSIRIKKDSDFSCLFLTLKDAVRFKTKHFDEEINMLIRRIETVSKRRESFTIDNIQNTLP